MKKEKSLIVEHYFWGENSFVFGVFGPRRGLQAKHGTVRKSVMSPQQAIKLMYTWEQFRAHSDMAFPFTS